MQGELYMGRKYASIHIFDIEQEKNLLIIRDFYNNDTSFETAIHNSMNIFATGEAQQMFDRFSQLFVSEVIILKSHSFISIYDETISFKTVEKKVEELSGIINNPLIYTSNYDGDLFIFGVYHAGHYITGGKVGNYLSIYGLEPEQVNIDAFCMELSVKRAASMDCLITSNKICEIEKEIEKIIEMPLNVKIDAILNNCQNFAEVDNEKRVRIYKRIHQLGKQYR